MWLTCAGLAVSAGLCGGALWRGVVSPRSQLFGPSVYRGHGERRSIALTFDDGPSPGTLDLLRLLAREHVKATFFVCGANVVRHPEIVRAVVAAGHELGNHTYSHARLCPRFGWKTNVLSARTVFQEVARAQAAIEAHAGVSPRLFRAPYGYRWCGLRAAQRRVGLLGVMWTVMGNDWAWSADDVTRHVLHDATPGGIICLHDGRDICALPDIGVTIEAVGRIIAGLKTRGYTFETVSGLLRSDAEVNALSATSELSPQVEIQ